MDDSFDIFGFVDTSGNSPDPNLYGACDKIGVLYKLKPRQCKSCLLLFIPEIKTQEKCEGCMSKLGEQVRCQREGCVNMFEFKHAKQRFCKDPSCKLIRIGENVNKPKEPKVKKEKASIIKNSETFNVQKEKEELIVIRAFEVLEGITGVKEVLIKTRSGLSISIMNQSDLDVD